MQARRTIAGWQGQHDQQAPVGVQHIIKRERQHPDAASHIGGTDKRDDKNCYDESAKRFA